MKRLYNWNNSLRITLMMIVVALIGVLGSHIVFGGSGVDGDVSVIEYSVALQKILPKSVDDGNKIQLVNINRMKQYMKHGLKMHVFPEYGLYQSAGNRKMFMYYGQTIQVGKQYCKKPKYILRNNNWVEKVRITEKEVVLNELACMAKEYQTILVVDMMDIETCSPQETCKSDGKKLYNTLVAIDQDGVVLAKYHKANLFAGESRKLDKGDGKPVYFTTKSGERFGMMICFDMMFEEPRKSLQALGIKNIVFSSWWVNFPPQLNALQMQQSFSLVHGLNLIASNSGYSNKSSGSGIYQDGSILAQAFNPTSTPEDQQLIVDFFHPVSQQQLQNTSMGNNPFTSSLSQTITRQSDQDSFLNVGKETKGNLKNMTILQPTSKGVLTIQSGPIQCTIQYDLQGTDYFMAYAATGISVGIKEAEICGIMMCGQTPDLCKKVLHYQSYPLYTNTIFNQLSIQAQINTPVYAVYPIVAESGMKVIQPNKIEYNNNQKNSVVLKEPSRLMSFQLMGLP